MSEAMLQLQKDKAKAIALTTARLDNVLQEAKKDEAKLKRILELRRMKRRLRAASTPRSR